MKFVKKTSVFLILLIVTFIVSRYLMPPQIRHAGLYSEDMSGTICLILAVIIASIGAVFLTDKIFK